MVQNQPITRRGLLVAGGVAAVGAVAACPTIAAASNDATWIDAHSHIWPPDASRFPLQPGMTTADLSPASFTDDELMAIARPEGVRRVVLIQHTWFHGFDNSYLMDAYQRHPDLFRIVGMIDDLRPKCGIAMKQLLAKGVTGFRIVPRKGISDWLRTDGMTEMWITAAETRQPMCCLINPENIPQVAAACERHPETPVVIDHFARVGIDGNIREHDLKALCDLAAFRHVKIKISAYYALGQKTPPHYELIPMIRRLFDTFGSERLMWASDCPYQLDGPNTYESSIGLIRDTIDFVTEAERRKLLHDTAEQTFFFA
jgi:predicted TIM-barrel fold metal-dependent hydrolase